MFSKGNCESPSNPWWKWGYGVCREGHHNNRVGTETWLGRNCWEGDVVEFEVETLRDCSWRGVQRETKEKWEILMNIMWM